MLVSAQPALAPYQPSPAFFRRDLEDGTRNQIAALASVQTLAPGQAVFYEGDAASSLFEVTRGVVRLFRMLPDGRRGITGFAFAGDVLGLSAADAYACTAEAVSECELRRYGRSALGRLLERAPDFGRRMLAIVADELSAAQDQMLLLGRKTAVEKVASFLLLLARKAGDGELRYVDLPMSRTDIADYLGLTTETVSRELTKLRQAGVISLPHPQRIGLLKRDALAAIAEEGDSGALGSSAQLKAARWPL